MQSENQPFHFLKTLCLFGAFFLAYPSMAYRGQNVVQLDRPVGGPSSGMPGYLDAQVVRKGQWVAELPTMSLHYGVTPQLTLGTNLIPLGVVAFTGHPSFALKARYQYFSNSKFASAVSVYGGGFWGDSLTGGYLLGTHNTTYFFSPYSQLTFHLGGAHASINQSYGGSDLSPPVSSRLGSSKSGIVTVSGISYQHYFTDFFGLQADLLYLASSKVSILAPGQVGKIGLLEDSWVFPWRTILNLKTNPHSILSLGLMGFYQWGRSEHKAFALPMLSYTWLIGL